jgi:hypothetical protein
VTSTAVAFVIFIIFLNIWYRNDRAEMTRAELDEDWRLSVE